MKIELSKRFKHRFRLRYEKYQFQVGILEDGPHRTAKSKAAGLKSYAGGPARKVGKPSDMSVSDVSKAFRERAGGNYLVDPFRKKSSDIMKFTKEFFKMVSLDRFSKRCENLVQAIVRNPILRGDYGSNSEVTQKIKGFNRFGIDTSQLFKAIKAKTIRKR